MPRAFLIQLIFSLLPKRQSVMDVVMPPSPALCLASYLP